MKKIKTFLRKLQRIALVKKYPFHKLSIFLLKQRMRLTSEEIAVISAFSSGETYMICSLLKSFCQANNIDKKVVLIGTKNYSRQIGEMFPDMVSRYHQIHSYSAECLQHLRKIGKGEIFCVYEDVLWKDLNSKPPFNQFDLVKKVMFLEEDAKMSNPSFSDNVLKNAKKKFDQLNLVEGKTIMLSPEAVSLKNLPLSFWQKVVNALNDSGYKVFLNSMDKNTILHNTIGTFLSFSEAVIFARLCGNVVALRSGFCDVISSAGVKFQVIYPNSNDLRIFSLNYCLDNDILDEYIYDSSDEDKLISKIISGLAK